MSRVWAWNTCLTRDECERETESESQREGDNKRGQSERKKAREKARARDSEREREKEKAREREIARESARPRSRERKGGGGAKRERGKNSKRDSESERAWLIHRCDMFPTFSLNTMFATCVRHDTFTSVVWLICIICDMTHSHVCDMCDTSRSSCNHSLYRAWLYHPFGTQTQYGHVYDGHVYDVFIRIYVKSSNCTRKIHSVFM